ncbi:MAG: hypothetical protein WKF80_08995 [Thermomicrobiales bacterium]
MDVYGARVADAAIRYANLNRRWNRLANLRLLAFVAGAGLAGWGFWDDIPAAVIAGLVGLVAFAWFVREHGRVGRERRIAALDGTVNHEAIARVRRDWAALPFRDPWTPAPEHPFSHDLNVFGPSSLAHLLSTTTTSMGQETLRRWLLEPARPSEVLPRQEAVAELAPDLDWRQVLERTGRLSDAHPDPETFLDWAEAEPWLAKRPALRWVARISTGFLWLTGVADILGLLGVPLWILPLVVNLILSQTMGGAVHGVIGRATTRHRTMSHYAGMLGLLADRPWTTTWSRRTTSAVTDDDPGAPAALRRLDRLAAMVIPRGSQLYVPIQALTMWDIHVLDALERWQVGPGRKARGWLGALGEVEAIAALAALAHAEPGWVFPVVGTGEDAVRAAALAHPLLPASRVANDVRIGPPGTFLLVTGSNMSGKSTLLRAIGANAVLAGMGGPVCAGVMAMPPVRIATSARVEDSLARGVSFFLAELQRLKRVVEVAAEGGGDGTRCLFLLDEILQGTNTAERQVAARQIIRRLIDLGAIGAVSTHDLTLAESPLLAAAADPIHFRETVGDAPGDAPMTFDYRSRPGLATSTNALRLMRLMGLDLTGDGLDIGGGHAGPNHDPRDATTPGQSVAGRDRSRAAPPAREETGES